jgi:4'-phosphopantetheinyl transferase
MPMRRPLGHPPFVEIAACRLDLETDAVDRLAGWLADTERQRAGRYRLARDRRRYIVARARMRLLLAARLGTHPRAVELSYGTYGKPFLAAGAAGADWRFNASHSGDLALFAFCRGRDVGIDVESVEPLQGADDLARQYFSSAELDAYLALEPRRRERGFFTCWTRTEACLKALGSGLQPSANLPNVPPAWRVQSFTPAPGHAAAVAVERGGDAAL